MSTCFWKLNLHEYLNFLNSSYHCEDFDFGNAWLWHCEKTFSVKNWSFFSETYSLVSFIRERKHKKIGCNLFWGIYSNYLRLSFFLFPNKFKFKLDLMRGFELTLVTGNNWCSRSSVQERLVGRFWSFWYVYTIN